MMHKATAACGRLQPSAKGMSERLLHFAYQPVELSELQ